MNTLPLITIIVGVYNGEKFLRQCLDSILNQNYSNLEVIVVNDGSKDESGKIIDEYALKDKRIIAIHQDNAGVCASRNNALNVSHGEYICIMDQDDELSSDYVSYFYGLIEKNRADIALTPDADKFFDKKHEDSADQKKNDKVCVLSGEGAAIEMLYHKFIIGPWNKMISKRIIDENHLKFNTKYFNGDGFAFSIECFLHSNKVVVGSRHVYQYRVGDPSTGSSVYKPQYIHSSIDAQQYIKSTFVNPSEELLKAWNFSNWHTHCDAFNIIVGCGAEKLAGDLYTSIRMFCQKHADCAFAAPISVQQKLRGLLFKIAPDFAAKFINHFRIRKFKKV